MIERTEYDGTEYIEGHDNDLEPFRIQNWDATLNIDCCVLDRDQTTALVERLQLWLATGSLHRKENA